jgi:mono/diheme cytochrome c family protein
MARVLIIATLFSLAGAASGAAQDRAARGAQVYEAHKCGVCHAIAGKGNAKGALDGVGGKLSAADIRAWIVDAPGMTTKTSAARKPPMKSYTLPNDDLEALVAYLSALK